MDIKKSKYWWFGVLLYCRWKYTIEYVLNLDAHKNASKLHIYEWYNESLSNCSLDAMN